MTSPRLLAAASAAVLCAAAAPAFAAVGTSAQVNSNASAAIAPFNTGGLPGVTDTHGQHVTGQASGLLGGNIPGSFASIGDLSPGAHNSVEASQGVIANWDNPNAGSIAVGSDWDIRAFDHVPDIVMQATNIDQTLEHTAPTWQYAFDATGGDNLFSMSFNVDITGDAAGRGFWNLDISEDGHDLRFATLSSGAIANGQFQQALQSGHSYVFTLTSNDGLAIFPNGRQTQHFQSNAGSQFAWQITGDAGGGGGGVPEPATWSLAILGFGLAGASLRRKARLAA